MQAKISIQLIAPDKATKQSRDLKCVFVFASLHSYHRSPDRRRSQGSKNQRACARTTGLMILLTVSTTSTTT